MKQKYFIAIVPPREILEKVELIKMDLFEKHGLKGALRSPAHITLHRPFEWKEEKENNLISLLEEFNAGPTFGINLKKFSCFEPRVIYVDVVKNELLSDLHQRFTNYAKSQLKLFNEAEDLRGFHPHMTIASRDLKKPKFYELWSHFNNQDFEEGFEFSGFTLLRLGSKWEILKKFNI